MQRSVRARARVMSTVLLAAVWVAVATAVVIAGIFAFWRVRSAIRVWRAGARRLRASSAAVWRDPGTVEALDLHAGSGGPDGAPLPPFTFVAEHADGSQPCVSVRDARGRRWRVKWGVEVQAETLATRLVWAAGYFVETTYFVREGRIDGVPALQKASASIDPDGRFEHARFELDDEAIKHFDEHSWAWNDNPFVGTRELNGLKIVMMWLSNWDAKDVRDVARGSNTAIFEYEVPRKGHKRPAREARYLIIDWGGTFGRWGNVVTRGRWDYEGFAAQNEAFVQGCEAGIVRFGYSGQRTADIADGIRLSDVEWLMRILGRLTDAQIASAIEASGGTPDEVSGFTRALRDRLDRLSAVGATARPSCNLSGFASVKTMLMPLEAARLRNSPGARRAAAARLGPGRRRGGTARRRSAPAGQLLPDPAPDARRRAARGDAAAGRCGGRVAGERSPPLLSPDATRRVGGPRRSATARGAGRRSPHAPAAEGAVIHV